jgi:hypothetical protein
MIKIGEFNRLINILTLFLHVVSNSSSTSKTKHVEYLTEMSEL